MTRLNISFAMMPPKKLTRSRNRMLAGVCGGLGDFFQVDPTFIRIPWVFITIASGLIPFALLYLICAILIPNSSRYE